MVTVEEALPAIRLGLETFASKYSEELQKNINAVFKAEAIPAIKEAYLVVYDRLANIVEGLYPSRIKGKDSLSLQSQRPLFVAQLDRELANASFEGGAFSVSIRLTGDEDADGRPTTPDSLNFYIEGVMGAFAFITPEHLEQRRPTSEASRGRVGRGFMISRKNYFRERWEEITGIPFSEVRHPVSGLAPSRILIRFRGPLTLVFS